MEVKSEQSGVSSYTTLTNEQISLLPVSTTYKEAITPTGQVLISLCSSSDNDSSASDSNDDTVLIIDDTQSNNSYPMQTNTNSIQWQRNSIVKVEKNTKDYWNKDYINDPLCDKSLVLLHHNTYEKDLKSSTHINKILNDENICSPNISLSAETTDESESQTNIRSMSITSVTLPVSPPSKRRNDIILRRHRLHEDNKAKFKPQPSNFNQSPTIQVNNAMEVVSSSDPEKIHVLQNHELSSLMLKNNYESASDSSDHREKSIAIDIESSPSHSVETVEDVQDIMMSTNDTVVVSPAPSKYKCNVTTVSNGMGKCQKLTDVYAGHLLLGAESEPTSVDHVRMIIEYICISAGNYEPESRFTIEFVLWKKFNAAVNKADKLLEAYRSEWMRIALGGNEENVVLPKHYSTRLCKEVLLPPPITLTFRELELITIEPHFVHSKSKDHAVKKSQSIRTKKTKISKSKTKVKKEAPINLKKRSSQQVFSDDDEKKHCTKRQAVMTRTSNSLSSTNAEAKIHKPKGKVRPENPAMLAAQRTPKPPVPMMFPTACTATDPLESKKTFGVNRTLPTNWDPTAKTNLVIDTICKLPKPRHLLQSMTKEDLEAHIASVRQESFTQNADKHHAIIEKLCKSKYNKGIFNKPVDPIIENIPHYSKIVKNPMDLGTVRKKLGDGQYMITQDFVSDVELIFQNAMLFNSDPKHVIHQNAKSLMQQFHELLDEPQKRRPVNCIHTTSRLSQNCPICKELVCSLCDEKSIPLATPHIQCVGGCNTDIRKKGSTYYVARDGTRIWCRKCYVQMTKTPHAVECYTKKMAVEAEPWVKCAKCAKWLHQICGLYNPTCSSHELMTNDPIQTEYVCPTCSLESVSKNQEAVKPHATCSTQLPDKPEEIEFCKSSSTKQTETQHTNQLESVLSGRNIPESPLGKFIQDFLQAGLRNLDEVEAADTLFIRTLNFPREQIHVPESIQKTFSMNQQMHMQLDPNTNMNRDHNMPCDIEYVSCGIYLFQKQYGADVCLFTLFAQEFGDNCAYEANRRSVYLAYIDSVRYLKPSNARTSAYHLIIMAYFKYLSLHGFERVYIWSCPPKKRVSYVFWCRPVSQKTPSADRLRNWYTKLLMEAQSHNIVKSWGSIYERHFLYDNKCKPEVVQIEDITSLHDSESVCSGTRNSKVKQVFADECQWPVPTLPPLFDGDFIFSEMERVLERIQARSEKGRHRVKNGKTWTSRYWGKRSNDNVLNSQSKHEDNSNTNQLELDIKLKEVFEKLQASVKQLKDDLLVVDLEIPENMSIMACRPEENIPHWCKTTPRFFGSRFMFHQLCAHSGYQFDTIRTAKHSTMMILHHLFNENIVQVNIFCYECNLLITHAEFWTCQDCERFALCDTCYQTHGANHSHKLVFGQRPRPV